jgi:hypothetical protein
LVLMRMVLTLSLRQVDTMDYLVAHGSNGTGAGESKLLALIIVTRAKSAKYRDVHGHPRPAGLNPS